MQRLLELVRGIEPGLQIKWDVRDAITLRVPGINRAWAQWRTKDPEGLICRFLGKKGQLNLAQVESLAAEVHISGEREQGDLLQMVFRDLDPAKAKKLQKVLAENLASFRSLYARVPAEEAD